MHAFAVPLMVHLLFSGLLLLHNDYFFSAKSLVRVCAAEVLFNLKLLCDFIIAKVN